MHACLCTVSNKADTCVGYCIVITTAPTDVTCWEKLNDLLYLVARKCGWLDIIQGKLVSPHKLV